IPIVFVITVGLITRWISNNRVRRELINANASPELAATLLGSPEENPDTSLKWGMVFIAIGLALFGNQLLNLDADDPIAFGLAFLFGGIALLLFYLIKSRKDA
ncbi:MAG: DUF6249 domain-containing protein, partial [Pseudomonadales bacterium]